MRSKVMAISVLVFCMLVAPASAASLGTNLLSNAAFTSDAHGAAGQWLVSGGNWGRLQSGSTWYYYCPGVTNASIYQEFDLSALGYDSHRLATGGYYADFGSRQVSYDEWFIVNLPEDQGQVTLKQYTSSMADNGSDSLPLVSSITWKDYSEARRIQAGTDKLRYWFDAYWVTGGNNDAYLTNTYLKVYEYSIWTYGDSPAHVGVGSWDAGTANVRIGMYGDGGVSITNGKTMTTGGEVSVGHFSGNVGTANIIDGTWIANDKVYAGRYGTGIVNISSAGQWNTNSEVWLAGSSGTVNVAGGWNAAGTVYVGNLNAGEVNVTGAGQWTSNGVVIGEAGSGNGQVNVTGATWTSNSHVKVGYRGTGEVNVTGAGQWTSKSVGIGDSSTGSGTVNVTGAAWTSNGKVTVGNDGAGVVNIMAGGTWNMRTGDECSIGADDNSSGTVNLDGGSWSSGFARVGSYGPGTVNIMNGGGWTAKSLVYLGTSPSALGVGTVNLIGGNWVVKGVTRMGSGVVNIKPGHWWRTEDGVRVGMTSGATAYVNVEGGTWTAWGGVTVGYSAPARVEITDGGKFNATAGLYVRSKGTVVLDDGYLTVGGTFSNSGVIDFRRGTLTVAAYATATGVNGVIGDGCNIVLARNSSLYVDGITFMPGSSLSIGAGRLYVKSGGYASFVAPLVMSSGNKVLLQNGQLIHVIDTLSLNGGQVTGYGEINVGSAGINLGTLADPGSLTGSSETSRLVVYGDVSGSGSITNTTIYGNVDIGASAGEMTLDGVVMGSASSIQMQIAGTAPAEFDRLVIGDGVVFGSAGLDIVFDPAFVPADTDTFQLFTAIGATSLFDTLGGVAIVVPDGWVVDRTTGELAVPEPVSASLLIACGALILRRRRRKAAAIDRGPAAERC